MIIGRGDIAREIPDREGFVFYANGCSNRQPLNDELSTKELWEIRSIDSTGKMFVYFSTLSIYYSDTAYTRFKAEMEKEIKESHDNYCIMRIGNIDWGDNPKTLINYLKSDQSRVEKTYRYILSKAEFKHWITMIPVNGQHQMNVTGNLTYVPDLVKQINEGKIYTGK